MAGLSGDCFAHGGGLLSVEEAAALVVSRVVPVGGVEEVALRTARGRVLATPLVAPRDLPPFRNSAVDGYALRTAELSPDGETRLELAGRVVAGQMAGVLPSGRAVRVLTGAPVPEGADAVVMQEDVGLAAGAVMVPAGLAPGANLREAGEDVARGEVALPAGRRMDAPAVGLAAALGFGRVRVTRRPVVGVFSTGDELVEPGGALGPASRHDSNRPTLLALLDGLPVEARDLGILPDQAGPTMEALRGAAASHDLLLTSGGVSEGEEDHVRAAIEAEGRLHFWKLAVKPGKPAALGVIQGVPVLGLPGNPVAAVVAFLHLARPLVLRLAGASEEKLPRFPAVSGFVHRKKAGRREYLRVSLRDGVAQRYPRDGSGLIGSLARTEAFVEVPEDVTAIEPGDAVTVIPYSGLF
ncbi:molybdopterin molybdotransferase MoeA [Roseomonas xinghualingensis]|uniref:molybdopterin molybdotransferase MoeA n=1 Tax=Roseomonas xinghualingensis TaxID=2986475 RepID=UPI0021F0FF36|nr:gephyrin-like molybdotransferase Glp [Roseomonas sp. SXEYE001]MCV4207979.1 molybdopterin molybdotransferase MoeA [Roseomonas sp. SXEYE001]